MEKLLKAILNKLFQSNHPSTQPNVKPISQEEVEALVDARLKEHAATIEKSIADQSTPAQPTDQEDYTLTAKQIEFALSLIGKVKDYELATDPSNLTIKDLNKLIAYNRFKNKGILVNLAKKGVLKN
ncbi:ABC transporter ATP-binding protein [Neobacillus sp. PS3-34]|uniref:ABC transporter ATP-binding protein n=1 Tax=Neobacillus sp. PS3-34 TaxID=3070678 RepID=UPI0027E0F303|nr:ABC transporter ATP-binding protein [Neobacillus sp. PS3-34]WML48478.1 ABC transporter ATP-binding protein [Neobacillus sp. PS3-34]